MRALAIGGLFVLLSSLGACAGGQTGEITTLGPCDEGTPIGGLEALDPEARARLEAALGDVTRPLSYSSDGAADAEVTLGLSSRDGAVMEMGSGGCRRLRAPVTLQLVTDDGRLDVALLGEIDLYTDSPPVVRARAPKDANEGSLDLSVFGPMPEGVFYAELDRGGSVSDETSAGQLFVSPSADEDEIPIASW